MKTQNTSMPFSGKNSRLTWLLCLSALIFAFVSLSGCSSSDDESDTMTGGESGELAANFPSIRAQVFEPNCAFSGCHSGSSAPFGLSLDEDVAYANLFNVMSGQQSDIVRVAPGDPDNSYLIQKLEGTAASGVQMPRLQAPLPDATIQIIRDWIANGALES